MKLHMSASSASTSPSILVAEDDSLIRDVYVEMLKNAGYTVEEAVDGKQTLEKMTKGGYDLVLLDIIMPFMDGLGILQTLKDKPPKNKNKITLICTSLAADPKVQEALEIGAQGVIFKPDITPDQLVESVKKYLAA
jgi:CheY-like chemotaxis protein